MASSRPRAPLLSPAAIGHLQADAEARPQGLAQAAAAAGARSPWLGASQPHSGLVSEGGSPTLDDDGEGIDESGEWPDGGGGDGGGFAQGDEADSQPKREGRPMQTVVYGQQQQQQQQDDVVVSQGGGQAAPSGRARPAAGRGHGSAAKRRRGEFAAQADGSEDSSSSGGGGGRGSGSGSGSRSSRSSSSSQSSSSSSSDSDGDGDGDERRDEDAAAATARRSHQARLLRDGQPMDVEAEEAAEAEAAAAQSAPNQPLFHCVTTNIDLILQLLHAVKLEKKEQVSQTLDSRPSSSCLSDDCPLCCFADSSVVLRCHCLRGGASLLPGRCDCGCLRFLCLLQMCRVYIASQGMKVVTSLDKSRSVCAKAYLKKDLFSQYTLRRHNYPQQQRPGAPALAQQRANDYTCFLSLANMIDCMQLLGGSKDTPGAAPPVMHFKIEEDQHPLVIRYAHVHA